MDEDKKKSMALGIFLGSIIIISALVFIWAVYLNKGKIAIYSEPPFTITESNGKRTECESSPCVIKQKPGTRDLILSKEGFNSMIKEVKVNLWSTAELQVVFKIKPYLTSTDRMPEVDKNINYRIIFNDKSKMYKLVDTEDKEEKALIYFQKEIKNPTIFGSKNAALIIEDGTNTAYVVDIKKGKRKKMENFNERVIDGTWSDNRKYFVYTKEDSSFLWLLKDSNEKLQLDIDKTKSTWAWGHDSSLVFVTNQLSASISGTGAHGDGYITLTQEAEPNIYTFGQYYPEENAYTKMDELSEIASLPEKLVPTSNGAIIYFQTGENKYKLNLK